MINLLVHLIDASMEFQFGDKPAACLRWNPAPFLFIASKVVIL